MEFEDSLDATKLTPIPKPISHLTFVELLSNIYFCYEEMLKDNIILHNNENKIRDMLLHNYLNKNSIRNKYDYLLNFLFDPEVPENSGRSDIKVQTQNTFINTKAYYIIECKRLDGYSRLNKEYIENGINRFISGYYSSYYNENGMIGFIVKEIDIDKNIQKIGDFFEMIEKNKLYCSNHSTLMLYHIMMDFSKNIK